MKTTILHFARRGGLCFPATLLSVLLTCAPGWAQEAPEAPGEAEKELQVMVVREGELYTLQSDGATLEQVLVELEKASGVPVRMPADLLANPVTLKLERVPYEAIAKALGGSHALVYERGEDGEYRLVAAQLTSQDDAATLARRDVSRKERRAAREAAKQVNKAMDEIAGLYGRRGEAQVLGYDEAKALIAERQTRFDELVQQLAALGPEGAFAMRDLYGEEGLNTRQNLAMLGALRRIESPDASAILATLYQDEKVFSLQREIISSLAYRADAEPFISSILSQATDIRLKAAATQALAGRPEAQDQLVNLIGSLSEKRDIRQEAVRSLGEIKSDSAREALASLATSPLEIPVRMSAIQELGRTFGPDAMGTFEVLLTDQDDRIRINTVKAVSRLRTPASVALLQRVATRDASEIVRDHAAARLPKAEEHGDE